MVCLANPPKMVYIPVLEVATFVNFSRRPAREGLKGSCLMGGDR
jgi:hypothetical protein